MDVILRKKHCFRLPKLVKIILLLTLYSRGIAQDTLPKKASLKGFPVVFYTPETRIGFGGAGVLTYHLKSDTLKKIASSITFGAAYTQNKQILAYVPFNLYSHQRKYWLYGETGFYRYNYYFYGIGPHQDRSFREYYGAQFLRIRLSAVRLISSRRFIYLGLKYAFDQIRITINDTTGQLYNQAIPGQQGGTVSGIGMVSNYDSRDHLFYPTKGQLVEFFIYHENNWTGSSFKYTRYTLDASHFIPIHRKHVLGFNFFGVYIEGSAPFTHLGLLGGLKRLRGYYEGRFRDKTALTCQTEWRYNFYKRLGCVVFGSMGLVADHPGALEFRAVQYTAGSGLRFALDKKQRINLRADFAFGHGSSGVYFTLGEAF